MKRLHQSLTKPLISLGTKKEKSLKMSEATALLREGRKKLRKKMADSPKDQVLRE